MPNYHYLCWLVSCTAMAMLLAQTEAAGMDLGIVSFPSAASQCSCSLSLTCTCCQSVVVNLMSMNKTLCLSFKIGILTVSIDITVKLDNDVISQFSINAKSPPSYCLPMLAYTPVAMCIKLHDVKMVGLNGMQICSTFYTSMNQNEVIAYKFPCVKLSTSGIAMI